MERHLHEPRCHGVGPALSLGYPPFPQKRDSAIANIFCRVEAFVGEGESLSSPAVHVEVGPPLGSLRRDLAVLAEPTVVVVHLVDDSFVQVGRLVAMCPGLKGFRVRFVPVKVVFAKAVRGVARRTHCFRHFESVAPSNFAVSQHSVLPRALPGEQRRAGGVQVGVDEYARAKSMPSAASLSSYRVQDFTGCAGFPACPDWFFPAANESKRIWSAMRNRMLGRAVPLLGAPPWHPGDAPGAGLPRGSPGRPSRPKVRTLTWRGVERAKLSHAVLKFTGQHGCAKRVILIYLDITC